MEDEVAAYDQERVEVLREQRQQQQQQQQQISLKEINTDIGR